MLKQAIMKLLVHCHISFCLMSLHYFKARLKRLNNKYVDLLYPVIIFIGQLSSCQNPELFNVYLYV